MAALFAIILIRQPIPTQKGFKPKSLHFSVRGVSLGSVLPFNGKHVQLLAIEEGRGWGPEMDRWHVIAFSNLMGPFTVLLYCY